MNSYKGPEVEKKWQQKWKETNLFTADLNSNKEKYYNLGSIVLL